MLALLGAHHFLHISRIRVKSLILRLLMSYIYIYIYIYDISSLRVNPSKGSTCPVLYQVTLYIVPLAPASYTSIFFVRCKIRDRLNGSIHQIVGVDVTSSSDILQILCRYLYVRDFNVEWINEEQYRGSMALCPVAKPVLSPQRTHRT